MSEEPAFKRDHVYLFQWNPSTLSTAPRPLSSSPHCAKVELFLAHHGVPYSTVDDKMPSNKYKTFPAIELNGEPVADSSFIIEAVTKHFNIAVDAHLSAHDKALSHAVIRMMDEHFYFCALYYAWSFPAGFEQTKVAYFGHMSWFMREVIVPLVVRPSVVARASQQGVGRFDADDVLARGVKDLHALSELLGEKKWLLGHDEPSLVDIYCVGFLQNELSHGFHTPLSDALRGIPNLVEYSSRGVETFLKAKA